MLASIFSFLAGAATTVYHVAAPVVQHVIIPTVAAAAAGKVTKDRSQAAGGEAHKVLSPAVAIAAGALVAVAGGDSTVVGAIAPGVLATWSHTIAKNAIQYYRLRRKART